MSNQYVARWVVVPVVRGSTATAYGVRTRYIEAGEGEPVLLVHGGGAGGSGGEGAWSDTVGPLSSRHRVIAPDLIWAGQSDKPPMAFSFQAQVEHLAGIIDALGLEGVNLVGQSIGAYIAAKYACDYPNRVRRLVILNSNSVALGMGIDIGPFNEGIRAQFAFHRNPNDQEALRTFLESTNYRKERLTPEFLEERRRQSLEPGVAEARESMDRYTEMLLSNRATRQVYTIAARLSELDSPICVLWGVEDMYAPVTLGRKLKAMLPRAEYHEIADASHAVFRDQPDEVNAILRRFLADETKVPTPS